MFIKYKRTTSQIEPLQMFAKGEWIDLRLAENISLSENEYTLASLGIRMDIPKEFEVIIVPRSGTFNKYGIIQANSVGVIDSSFKGKNDIWKFPALATRAVFVPQNTRICQFRIQPSQKAGVWTKLKWLFTDRVIFVEDEYLSEDVQDRGGFGSTGEM